MIYIFTGDGKGKTTSALGMGLRAVGAGKKVLMIQFLKTGFSSEIKVIRRIKGFTVKSFGQPGFGPYLSKDRILAEKGLNFFAASAGKYDFVILDEINVALKFGLLDIKDVLKAIRRYAKKLDIVLTGRYCPKKILDIADLVTEFKEIKHYFKKGIKARRGIEY